MSLMKQIPLTCSGHTRPVVDLDFSDITPYSYFLISACKDGKPMLRQGDTGDWIGTFEGHKGAVWSATLNKDATKAATGAADFSAKLWDAASGDELHTFAHKHIVKSVQFSPSSDQLLTGSNEKLIRLFDLENYDSEPMLIDGHSGNIKKAIWTSDGTTIVSAAEDETVRLWDARSLTEIHKIELPQSPASIELSKDGRMLVVTHGRFVEFFEMETFQEIKSVEIPTIVNSASLHHDNKTFVCGGVDFKMYKYDLLTGLEIESYGQVHFGPIHCVKFSPDGDLFASGSEDGTLRLWQTDVGKNYGLWKCMDQQAPLCASVSC